MILLTSQGSEQAGPADLPADPAQRGQDGLQHQHGLPPGQEAERGGRLGVPVWALHPPHSVQQQGERM